MGPRMPAKGSSVYTPFTGVLPTGKQETINSGIPLFELVMIGSPAGNKLFGFRDVDVKILQKERSQTFKLEYIQQWHRGGPGERGYITYEWDKATGRSYSFIPDDEYWFNRFQLAETIYSEKYAITRYIHRKGVVAGEAMEEEIKFIADNVFDNSVTSEGKVVFRSKVLKEATDYEKKLKLKGKGCQTVKSKIKILEDMIKNPTDEEIERYGKTWMLYPRFVEFRTDLEKKISEKFRTDERNATPVQISNPAAIVARAIQSLPAQEVVALFQRALAGVSAAPAAQESNDPEIDLEKVGTPQIMEMAEELGIFTKGMQREDVIRAIREINGKSTDIEPPQPSTEVFK